MPSEQSHEPLDGSIPIEEVLANRALIVASNRGPVTFSYSDDGTFTSRKGSGGVVTAVSAIARDRQPILRRPGSADIWNRFTTSALRSERTDRRPSYYAAGGSRESKRRRT